MGEWKIHIYRKDVYLAFCSWLSEISQISITVKAKQQWVSTRYVFISLVSSLWVKDVFKLYISAWASALLVQTVMGNARASESGTGNRYRFPRFFFIYVSHF